MLCSILESKKGKILNEMVTLRCSEKNKQTKTEIEIYISLNSPNATKLAARLPGDTVISPSPSVKNTRKTGNSDIATTVVSRNV